MSHGSNSAASDIGRYVRQSSVTRFTLSLLTVEVQIPARSAHPSIFQTRKMRWRCEAFPEYGFISKEEFWNTMSLKTGIKSFGFSFVEEASMMAAVLRLSAVTTYTVAQLF